MFNVTIRNPISNAPIRTYEFETIPEMNGYLAFLASVRLYAYSIGKDRTVYAAQFTYAA